MRMFVKLLYAKSATVYMSQQASQSTAQNRRPCHCYSPPSAKRALQRK